MKSFTVICLSLWLALGAVASAQSTDGPATAFLRTQQETASRLLARSSPANAQQLSAMIGEFLDYDELARRALSDHWAGLETQKRTEFVSLLRTIIERNYRSSLENTAAYAVAYLGEASTPQGVVVRTTVRSRSNRRAPEISLDYTFRADGTRFRVVDITTDGVSLVRNYRTQFNRIINRDGFDALLTRMRSRASGESGQDF